MQQSDGKHSVSFASRRSRWRSDLVLIVALTILAAWASAHWQIAEFLTREFQSAERFQLDEAPGVLLVLATGSLWYAWRRYREARAALTSSLYAEQRLTTALSDNRRLVRQYADAQEAERARLSRDLHDELGQYLNAVKVEAVMLRLSREQPAAIDRIADSISSSLDHMQGAVAALIRQLRPVGLDELGLAAALEHCINGWRQRMPTTRFELRCEGDLSKLGEALRLTVYRLAQEGLTNAARHAKASRIQVEIGYIAQQDGSSALEMHISDDGLGADLHRQGSAGLGLMGMRERVEALGGTLSVDTGPHQGFRLAAYIPLNVLDTGKTYG